MPLSFIAAPRTELNKLSIIANELSWEKNVIEAGSWSIAVDSLPPQGRAFVSSIDQDKTLIVIGEVLNRKELRSLLGIYSSLALTASDAELVHLLMRELGESALGLIEGCFVGLLSDHASGTLRLFSDTTGAMPCYLTTRDKTWISSEIKLLRRSGIFKPDFAPFHALGKPEHREDSYTPLTNLRRIKPGEIVRITKDGYGIPVLESHLYHAFRPCADRVLSKNEALLQIDTLMRSSMDQCLNDAIRVGVPLSGGLDSSLVTALAKQSIADLSTFSIGTDLSNEFEFASQVAEHLGTRHREFVLSDDDVMTGLIEAIYFNEICDGLSAEIQAPLFALYRKVQNTVDTLITGYGSDLLFGGILPLQHPTRTANEFLWEQVYRTRWTGEFSTFGARHYGIKVRHPFWSNQLIGFCLDLCPSLKVSQEEVKIILREYAADQGLLPANIIWRKKIGIHEGSSINRMFASKLKTKVASYDIKSQFCYFVFREFFEKNQKPWTIDHAELMQRFVQSMETK